MNLADALKKLYTKLGGTDVLPQGTDTCTLVDKIADEVSGGGSSGGGVFYVNILYDESTDSESLDKTYNQIKSAVNSGQVVLIKNVETYETNEETHIDCLGTLISDSNGVAVSYARGSTVYAYESKSADGVLTHTDKN